MATWSGTRKKLETDYLAESLRGHIRYFATSYSRCPDHEGRAAIYLDNNEILSGNYFNQWVKADQIPKDEKYCQRISSDNPFQDETALKLGMFDQRSFYEAFDEFDNQSIEKSLESENLIVRIFAVLDRRVGKRRLKTLAENIAGQPESVKKFINVRLNAENIVV